MVTESWVEVHDGYYEVSNLGNVRRAKPGIATFVGRPVMPVYSAGGYAMVAFSGPRTRRVYVHQIVAEAFIGPRPDGLVINHKDGDKRNNSVGNLEYVTRKQNAAHAVRNLNRRKGPKKPKPEKVGPPTGERHWTRIKPHRIARGAAMPHSKLTADGVIAARKRVADGERQCDVAKELGISVAQMSRIIQRKRWSYV